tara:strand:- start:2203 stop:3273 length:1071 start_codon:yes stop_codon:yes gene_type:complete
MYFNRFPKINYDFITGVTGANFSNLEMTDIFRRVQFTEKTLKDKKNFEEYHITEGEKPDDVANKFYGNPSYWWLVLLCNGIIDVENEWPKSVSELDKLFSGFLTGNSYYLFESIDAREGDIIVKRDTISIADTLTHGGTAGIDIDNYGIIDNYNPLLRKLDVKVSSGTLVSGDEVHIFRKGVAGEYVSIGGFGETGCYQPHFGSTFCVGISGPESNEAHTHWGTLCATQGSTFGIIQKKDSIRNSVIDFTYKGDMVNPYSAFLTNVDGQNNGPSGDFFSYQSLCGMTGTILYDYITDNIHSDVNPVTKFEDILNTNDRNRHIKLISPRLAGFVVSELETLLSGSVPRGTTTLLEIQ